MILLALFWIFCFIVSFYLFQRNFRKNFDFTFGDFFFGILVSSLGPVSLFVAISITFITWLTENDKVIWKKYEH